MKGLGMTNRILDVPTAKMCNIKYFFVLLSKSRKGGYFFLCVIHFFMNKKLILLLPITLPVSRLNF